MCRVIEEVRPAWVLGENVPGIVNLALDTVLSDLENIGYTGQAFIIPACGVDAPHKRERVAIVAYAVNRGGTMRRDGKLQDIAEDGREGLDNGGRTESAITGERRQNESRTSGMADGLRTEIHGAAAYSGSVQRERSGGESFLFTNSSSRERERESNVRGYRGNLQELVEVTPRGVIGRMNPEYAEWLMGYQTGWTESDASETQ